MEQEILNEKETKNLKVSLIKNTIRKEVNFSIVSFSKKHNMELSREVFDTLRKANNKYIRK